MKTACIPFFLLSLMLSFSVRAEENRAISPLQKLPQFSGYVQAGSEVKVERIDFKNKWIFLGFAKDNLTEGARAKIRPVVILEPPKKDPLANQGEKFKNIPGTNRAPIRVSFRHFERALGKNRSVETLNKTEPLEGSTQQLKYNLILLKVTDPAGQAKENKL